MANDMEVLAAAGITGRDAETALRDYRAGKRNQDTIRVALVLAKSKATG